jgi:hypothetical protein
MKYPARETQREGGQPRGLSWLAVCVAASWVYERARRETWIHSFSYQTICNQFNLSSQVAPALFFLLPALFFLFPALSL